ncbi:MAG: SDR family oxidoreductase [Syntrophomonadaceae bacterium]
MILVTGITGLTGRFLFKALRTQGYQGKIRCLVRESSDVSWMDDDNFELVVGDVNDYNSLVTALAETTAVIHLVNIRSSPQVIQACYETGVKRAIFVNTTGIFSKYQQYAAEYQRLEAAMVNCTLDYTIIRPTMIYGNHQDKNIHKLVKVVNKYPIIPVLGSGYGLMQPIYAADLAVVIARALQNDVSLNKAYNVAGRDPIRFKDMMDMISRKLGKRRLFITVPYFLALAAGYLGEIIPNGLIDVEKVRRLQEDKVFSYAEAFKDMDFAPLSFEQGVTLEVESLKDAGII